ncbi:hypothetical protein ABH927_005763 [Planotetraspora sp. GP83]
MEAHPAPGGGRHTPTLQPSRRERKACRLRVGDYVHDRLAPMTVDGFEPACPGTVRIVGTLDSGTVMRVTHPARRELDVTRLIPAPGHRHLTLCRSERQ